MFIMFCPNCGKENDPSVRHCASCGSFIPDFSSDAASDQAGSLNLSETPEASQPMSYQALSQEDLKDLNDNQSRYQEYSMSDVVAKKSKKKLIITLVVIAGVIALGVASFFIIRGIMSGNALKGINEDPTKYVFDSYKTTAETMTTDNTLVKSATASTNDQKTVRVSVTGNDFSQTSLYSIDLPAKKLYYMTNQSWTVSEEMKKYFMGPQNVKAELYTDMDKAVAKVQLDDKSFDGYVNLGNLREDAVSSMFGPKGENLFKVDQKTYDVAMDVYEFIYNNLKKDTDPFGLTTLASKLKDDFDKSGSVAVAQENVDIDGTKTDAFVITHTFNNTDVVATLLNDVKDWAKTNIRINDEINTAIDQALEKMDVDQLVSQLNASMKDFEIVLKHYVNKDNALMQAELIATVNGQSIKLTITFGADPANSKKITIKAATVGGSAESVLQSITVTNESTAQQDKYVATYSGMLLVGNTTYTRDTATGDFTITNDMSNPLKSMMSSSSQGDIVPSNEQSLNFNVSGNLKTTDDSLTLTFSVPVYDGYEVKYEYYISGKAEITELTSQNNLLTAKSSDYKELGSILGFTPNAIITAD